MQIPGFEMQELIGEGAMAFVWKARQESLDRTVAVKMLKPGIARNPEDITSFLREARAAAALKHPGIVQIYDIAERDGAYYLVLEYINGPTVGHLIARNGPMPVKRALTVVRSVAEALDYAWDRAQIIHRDIKPHNILVDADGTVKLSDLGLARSAARNARADAPATEYMEGTPNYISPEQARGASHIDCATDMYSLGASLYHMVTGRIPFGDLPPMEAARQQVSGCLPNPRDLVPDLPVGVAQLIARLMMRDPAARFGSWPEASEAIRRVAAGRMMLTGRQPEGDCTVAPPAASTAAEPALAARRRAVTLSRPERIPPAFRTAAWVVLLALWGVLVWQRTRLPPLIPIPERTFQQGEQVDVSSAHAPTPPAMVMAGHADAPPEPPAAAARNDQPPIGQPPTAPPPATVADTAQGRLSLMANYLLAENFVKAEQMLTTDIASAAPEQADALRSLRDFIIQVARMPRQIEGEFMRHVGTKVTIVHNGQSHEVLLNVVAAGKVSGEMETDKGSVPVQFEIAQLSPVERSRWLGLDTTPAVNAMKCILLLKGGELDSARELAPRCGPLSALLQQQLATRGQ